MKMKRLLSMLLCAVMVVSLFTGLISSASAADEIDYTVVNGDYLFKICRAYGLDYYQCKNAIMVLNGYTSELQLNRLTVGQGIKLPASNAVAATVKGSTSTTTTTTNTVTINGVTTTTTSSSTINGVASNYNVAFYLIPYVMQYGDTLASVCNTMGSSYGAYSSMILGMNNIKNANNVWAGKTVYIPSTKAPASGACYAVVAHTVSSGETMTNICSAYGTSYQANATLINGLNSAKNLNKIYAGQQVYIPVVATIGNNNNGNTPVVETGYKINLIYSSANGVPYAQVKGNTVTKTDAGNTVTIFGGANKGYALNSIVATRADNNANIVLTNHSFTMPPCDVNVNVKYSNGYHIERNVIGLNSGTFETTINDEAVEYASYGDVIVLKMSPKTGYSAQTVKVSGTVLAQKADGTYSFKMPDNDIVVEVVFAKTAMYPLYTKHCNAVDNSAITGAGTVTYTVDGVQNNKAAKNTQVLVNIAPNAGYSVDHVYVVKHTEDPLDSTKRLAITKNDANNYQFKMPDNTAGVDVYVYYEKLNYIYTERVANGYVTFAKKDGTKYVDISYASKGETVYIIPHANSGYVFDDEPSTPGSTMTKISVSYANGISSTPAKIDTSNMYYFIMPDQAPVVKAAFKESSAGVQYAVNVSVENGWAQVKVKDTVGNFVVSNRAIAGQKVRVYVYPKAGGYIISSVDPSTLVLTSDVTGDYYPFTMGSADRNVIVKYEYKTENVDITGSQMYLPGGTLTTGGSIVVTVDGIETDNAKFGYTMTATITPPDGYKTAHVYVRKLKADSTEIGSYLNNEITANGNGTYSYLIKTDDKEKGAAKIYFMVAFENDQEVKHKVQAQNNKYTVDGTSGPAYIEAVSGKTITVKPNAGFEIAKLEVFTGSNENKTDISFKTVTEGQEYTFVMPNEDVTTLVDFVAKVTTSSTDFTISCNPADYKLGDTVKVTLCPVDGTKALSEVTIGGALQTLPTGYVAGEATFEVTLNVSDTAVTATVS